MLELLEDYGVSPISNICDLTQYIGLNEEDLRIDRF